LSRGGARERQMADGYGRSFLLRDDRPESGCCIRDTFHALVLSARVRLTREKITGKLAKTY